MTTPTQPVQPETPRSAPQEHPAVQQANLASDYWIYALNVGLVVGGVFLLGVFGLLFSLLIDGIVEENVGNFLGSGFNWLIIGAVITVVILVTIRMMRQIYLGNALQVEYSDYAWLRDWSNTVAADLNMPRVEIMITQDPVINAYAFGFMKPYTIVLNSGSIRWLTREQLKAIVVHEMAHVKYHHTAMGAYATIIRTIPGIGVIFSWMIDFWSRRAEYTADRLALCYLRDPKLVKESLIRVHVGPDVAASFNDIARQWQVYMTNNTFNTFTQTFSSHPFLVRRLQHIDEKYAEFSPTWPASKESKKPAAEKE